MNMLSEEDRKWMIRAALWCAAGSAFCFYSAFAAGCTGEITSEPALTQRDVRLEFAEQYSAKPCGPLAPFEGVIAADFCTNVRALYDYEIECADDVNKSLNLSADEKTGTLKLISAGCSQQYNVVVR